MINIHLDYFDNSFNKEINFKFINKSKEIMIRFNLISSNIDKIKR